MSINNLNTYLNIKDSHLRVVSGNVYAQAMNIGGINVETAHGLQSVSDTGNVTSNTLQFSNATTGFITTANAQIGRDIVVSGNATVSTDLTVSANATVTDTLTISEHLIASKEATVTGNLHVTTIQSDSNVVAEYTGPHDRPLRKYPEVALTANSDKGYVAIGSSNGSGSYPEYTAFDGVVTNSTTGWASNGTYASGTGISTFSWNGSFGEYLSLELPKALRLQKMFLKGYEHSGLDYQNAPRDIKLYGSNNETNWVLLKTETDLPIDSITSNSTYININATEHYKYIRLQITKTYRRIASYTRISELEYYGHEEGSGSLDTTLKSVYNVPATTGTQLEVYYDAKGESTVQSPIPDLSPNTNTGALSTPPPTLDETDGIESFKFNGSSQYINAGNIGVTAGSGEYPHSMSAWIKIDTLNSTMALTQIGSNPVSAGNTSIFYINTLGNIILDISGGSNTEWYSGLLTNQWYHVSYTYNGGASGRAPTSYKLYINGVDQGHQDTGAGSGTLNLVSSSTLAIGSNHLLNGNFFDGSVANFRHYSKILNADQIKELYDYQKDYFLGSKSQVTLYKGHLGVGVTEPSGQLELAGDERIQEYPPRAMTGYETLVEGHGVFCAYASSRANNYRSFDAFDNDEDPLTSTAGWVSALNTYDTGGTGLASGGSAKDYFSIYGPGSWLKLKLPYAIKLKSSKFSIRAPSNTLEPLKSFTIYGSKDNTNWDALYSQSTSTPQSFSIDINSTEYYKCFVIHITEVNHNYGYAGIVEWRLFGTPGPTTLDKGSLTLGRSLDVPRISRYDVDTETPRPEKLVLDFDTTVNSSPTDISGKGNHGVFYGTAQYSAADKAFTGATPSSGFNGTSNYIKATLNGASGAYAHTQSYWINGVDATPRCPFTVGKEDGNYSYLNIWLTTSQWTLNSDGAAGGVWAETIYDNRWYHVVLTYDGGTSTDSYKLYIDGEYKTPTTAISINAPLALPSNPEVRIGRNDGSQWYNGMVSNPKVYSVALEPSEVKKLYNLGRTGRSMVISDTAVGIGKVPEAQLDVRGVLKASVGLFSDKPFFACDVANFGLKDNGSQTIYWHTTRTDALSSTSGGGSRWRLGITTGNHTYRTNNVQLVRVLNDTTSETSGVKVPYTGYYHLTHNLRTKNINVGASFWVYSPRHNKYIQTSIASDKIPWGGNSGANPIGNSVSVSLYLEEGDVVIFVLNNSTSGSVPITGGYEQSVSLVMV